MKRRQTIVLVANDVGGKGGMESHLEEVITRLKRDYNVVVVATTMNLRDPEGVRFVRVPVISRPVPIMLILFAIVASFRLLFIKRDLLHTTGAIVFNRADFSTVHFCIAGYRQALGGREATQGRPWPYRLNQKLTTGIALAMEKLIYRPSRTKRLIAVSNRVKSEIISFFPYDSSMVEVIPNGVDVQTFRPYDELRKRETRMRLGLPEKALLLLFMGGDWQRKGLDYVIAAFNQVAEQFPTLELLIVGSGDSESNRKQVAAAYRHRVRFVGKQLNPEEWLGSSDLFICPTLYETFSLAVHEAAAAGLTIMATMVGGVEDLIDHKVDGYFIERDADQIADSLRELLLLEGRSELGIKAHNKVQALTWDHTYRLFSELYDRELVP
ncbi:glycosyltransferase family 4 protein [Cohnella sp. AR92]|uniref:glycosyltransferase family 4 protein n=1 Tax=Cohnella sp. AR92 TaxID=648716 RepID=UPI001315AB67|nr:glycosyltransferase family 4 protein [Cohnella sp. AR92]